MKTRTARTNETQGIYSAYWKVEEDNGGYKSVELIMPNQAEAPNKVKLMLIDNLLKDLNIPIRIEEHMIRDK